MNPDSQIDGNIDMPPYLVVQRLMELRDEVTWAEYRAALRIAIEMLSGKHESFLKVRREEIKI